MHTNTRPDRELILLIIINNVIIIEKVINTTIVITVITIPLNFITDAKISIK